MWDEFIHLIFYDSKITALDHGARLHEVLFRAMLGGADERKAGSVHRDLEGRSDVQRRRLNSKSEVLGESTPVPPSILPIHAAGA